MKLRALRIAVHRMQKRKNVRDWQWMVEVRDAYVRYAPAVMRQGLTVSCLLADGTYPHFGASHAPPKQENTYNDAMLDEGYSDPTYPVASDGSTIPDSLPLDSIPEEMEAPHEHYPQKDNKHGKKVKNERRITEEDLEEGLRTSQMEGTRSSHEHEIEIESLQDPPEQTPSGAHRVPNPSPASNLSTGSYNEDPRLVRPELRRMQAHQPRMDSADSDGR